MAQGFAAAVQVQGRGEARPKVAGGKCGGAGDGKTHDVYLSEFVMDAGSGIVSVDLATPMWQILEMNGFDFNHQDL